MILFSEKMIKKLEAQHWLIMLQICLLHLIVMQICLLHLKTKRRKFARTTNSIPSSNEQRSFRLRLKILLSLYVMTG